MTKFRYMLKHYGSTPQEAADFLKVSTGAIKSWSYGRRTLPPGVFQDLANLYGRIRDLAYEKAEKIMEDDPGVIQQRFICNGRQMMPGTAFHVMARERQPARWPC